MLGCIGNYNIGNFGDTLFWDVIEDVFKDYNPMQAADIPSYPYFTKKARDRLSSYKGFLIGGGDLITTWTDFEYFWEPIYLNKPCFVVGVGVATQGGFENNAVDKVKYFLSSDSVKVVHIRDQQSYNFIGDLIGQSKLIKGWDLAFSLNLSERITKKDNYEFSQISKNKIAFMLRFDDDWQSRDVRNLCRTVEILRQMGKKVVCIIGAHGYLLHLEYVRLLHTKFLFDEIIACATANEIFDEIAACDIIVSQKYHGLIAGIISNIKVFSIMSASKFENLFSELGIEHSQASDEDRFLAEKIISTLNREQNIKMNSRRDIIAQSTKALSRVHHIMNIEGMRII